MSASKPKGSQRNAAALTSGGAFLLSDFCFLLFP